MMSFDSEANMSRGSRRGSKSRSVSRSRVDDTIEYARNLEPQVEGWDFLAESKPIAKPLPVGTKWLKKLANVGPRVTTFKTKQQRSLPIRKHNSERQSVRQLPATTAPLRVRSNSRCSSIRGDKKRPKSRPTSVRSKSRGIVSQQRSSRSKLSYRRPLSAGSSVRSRSRALS